MIPDDTVRVITRRNTHALWFLCDSIGIALASTRKAAEMQTYTLGDTIRIEISLRDKTGIGYIAAVFNGCITHTRQSGGTIVLIGDAGNRTEASVELRAQITNQTIPGEYRCEYIQVQDSLGNQILHHPDIRFRIEDIPGDHEGPELLDWRFE